MPRAKHVCIACSSQIQQLHTALNCEECNRWQHLRCGTGISQSFYWKVVRCLGVFEWSCSACRTTQSEGNETSQISPQPKRRCSHLDGDGFSTNPPKRRRPASIPSQSAAPVISQFSAPVSSQPTTPVPSRPAAPVSMGPAAPVPSRPAAPVPSRPVAPVSSRPAAPVSSRPAAPVSSRPAAPVSSRPAAPVSSRPAAPVSSRPAAPVSSQPAAAISSSVPDSHSESLKFYILEKGSNQGFPLLLSSDGYDYHAQTYNRNKWRCSLRTCRTFVDQDGDTFKYGPRKHCHPARPFLRLSREMLLEARVMAVKYPEYTSIEIGMRIYNKAPKNATDIPDFCKLSSIVESTRRRLKIPKF